jgi:hypothetical protein
MGRVIIASGRLLLFLTAVLFHCSMSEEITLRSAWHKNRHGNFMYSNEYIKFAVLLILSSYLRLGFRVVTFIQDFQSKLLSQFSPMRSTYPDCVIAIDLTTVMYVTNSTNCGTHHNILSSHQTLHPSQVQIFSPASCPYIPPDCVIAVMRGTKFWDVLPCS